MNKEEYLNIFLESLNKTGKAPNCRFCGSQEYAALDSRGMVLLDEQNKDTTKVTIPAGVIVCKKCGHIDLFALGIFSPTLMPKKVDPSTTNNSENPAQHEDNLEQK